MMSLKTHFYLFLLLFIWFYVWPFKNPRQGKEEKRKRRGLQCFSAMQGQSNGKKGERKTLQSFGFTLQGVCRINPAGCTWAAYWAIKYCFISLRPIIVSFIVVSQAAPASVFQYSRSIERAFSHTLIKSCFSITCYYLMG